MKILSLNIWADNLLVNMMTEFVNKLKKWKEKIGVLHKFTLEPATNVGANMWVYLPNPTTLQIIEKVKGGDQVKLANRELFWQNQLRSYV